MIADHEHRWEKSQTEHADVCGTCGLLRDGYHAQRIEVLEAEAVILRNQVQEFTAREQALSHEAAELRDIVDRLAYEDTYRDPDHETYSSTEELGRLIDRARRVLAQRSGEHGD